MMEKLNGTEVAPGFFGAITPEHVLLEYDGPRFFTGRLRSGTDVLAFFCEEGDSIPYHLIRYLVVPTATEIVEGLEAGSLSIRDALTRTTSRPWLVDVIMTTNEVHQAWSVARADVPDAYLPKPGVMLRRELQPLLSVRMEGPELLRGSTPREAVIHAFKNVPSALKRLLDYVLDREERSQEWVRALYRMPAQRFAFGSFEVAYRRPPALPALDDNVERALAEVGALLDKALMEASGQATATTGTEREAVLDAAERLAPPSRGPVHTVTFAGSMVSPEATKRRLTQESKRRIARLRSEADSIEPQPFELTGRAGNIDFDFRTFQLRDVVGSDVDSIAIHFKVDLLDSLVSAAKQGRTIRAVGRRETSGDYWLLAMLDAESG